eukprot:gnl/Spiro4/1528_TR827_c0_g1_i1.p1 gnl/Spiro4/1528_TR827_c0_g1~~gnl/Spiro4/1528_TR827_c0_g1_i1.p1  ORF type:complete len:374 (+),score=70.09 gnl/Spiro4/1528_TR827_c0_g1_i1:76-1197(+)
MPRRVWLCLAVVFFMQQCTAKMWHAEFPDESRQMQVESPAKGNDMDVEEEEEKLQINCRIRDGFLDIEPDTPPCQNWRAGFSSGDTLTCVEDESHWKLKLSEETPQLQGLFNRQWTGPAFLAPYLQEMFGTYVFAGESYKINGRYYSVNSYVAYRVGTEVVGLVDYRQANADLMHSVVAIPRVLMVSCELTDGGERVWQTFPGFVQEYVDNAEDDEAEEILKSESDLSAMLAAFDFLTFQADHRYRASSSDFLLSNVLAVPQTAESAAFLVTIDHDCCLPPVEVLAPSKEMLPLYFVRSLKQKSVLAHTLVSNLHSHAKESKQFMAALIAKVFELAFPGEDSASESRKYAVGMIESLLKRFDKLASEIKGRGL